MKIISLRLALQTAIFAVVFAAAGCARRSSGRGAKGCRASWNIAKPAMGCRAKVIADTIRCPDSAGQQPKYLENQLRAFIERRRTNPVMFNVAHGLTPEMVDGPGRASQGAKSRAIRRRPAGIAGLGKNNLRAGIAGIQHSCMLRLPWSGGQGQQRNSSARGSALLVHRKSVDELDQRARSGFGAGHFGHHGADDAQLEPIADRRRRGLRQLSEVNPIVLRAPVSMNA